MSFFTFYKEEDLRKNGETKKDKDDRYIYEKTGKTICSFQRKQ